MSERKYYVIRIGRVTENGNISFSSVTITEEEAKNFDFEFPENSFSVIEKL